MYEDFSNNSVNWRPYIMKGAVVLGLVAFMFVLVTLVRVTTEFSSAYVEETDDNAVNYSEYLDILNEGALEYFSSSKPTKLGSHIEYSVSALINDEIISDFSNKKLECDFDKSYIRLTNMGDKKYTLKSLLICNGEVQFTIKNFE